MGWLGGALGWVWDHTLGPVASGAAGFVWDQVVQGLVSWIVDSVSWFVGQVLTLLEDSTKVDLRAGWFLDPGGPYRTVLGIAAALLLGFVFLGLVQGLVAGDPMVMVTRVVRDLPLAVLGMVVTIEVTTRLLQLSDALSHAVLRGGGDNAKEVLRVISTTSAFSGQSSFVVALLGLLCIVAALFVWIELVIRAALVYLLIAFSPLVFAAMVWPAARGMVRKLADLLLALIFSKVVIAIAFSVGAAALAGVGNAGHASDIGGSVSANAGTLFSGLVIFGLAAFAPFVLLKLFPAAEAAVVAQGVSRGPMRATQQASSSAFYLERLAGTPSGTSSNGSSQGARPASRDLGSGPAGGSPPTAGKGPGPSPTGPGGAGGTGAAAAGPAAVALGGVEVAERVGNRVARSADQTTDAGAARRDVPGRRGDAP
jgi:DNA processing protein